MSRRVHAQPGISWNSRRRLSRRPGPLVDGSKLGRPANPARRSLALMTDELRRNCHDPDREDDHDAHHGKENLRRAAFHSLRFRFSSAVR